MNQTSQKGLDEELKNPYVIFQKDVDNFEIEHKTG